MVSSVSYLGIFFLILYSSSQNEGIGGGSSADPTRVASIFAKHVTHAMVPHLKHIKHQGLTPFAVKISLDPDNVSYTSS